MDDPMDRTCPLRTLNEMITCKICHGYLIDATTGKYLTLKESYFCGR